MKTFFAGALLSLSLLSPVVAWAQEPTTEQLEQARQLFEQGQEAYNNSQYGVALGFYTQAYEMAKKPTILFNIGQCYRKLGKAQEASDSYKKFLRDDPQTQYLGEVEYKIAELAEELKKPTEALDYYEKYLQHKVADDPNEAKAKERIDTLKKELDTKVPDGPEPIPAKKPVAAYALFGVSAVSWVGVAVFGTKTLKNIELCADGDIDDDNTPGLGCAQSDKSTPAITTDAFLVAALASAGVGAVLLLKAKKSSTETTAKKPNTALRLIPTTTGGFVTFSFTPAP